MAKRKFIISVDVEALPNRAESDHVTRLIWGEFPGDARQYGITSMIQEGDRAAVPFTFYLDFAEYYRYGESINTVARTISSSGHDLQLHIHPEMLPPSFWKSRGLTQPEGRRYNYSEAHCRAVMDAMVSDMEGVTGISPLAYRAGAFQINESWLKAAYDNEIKISSNHCYASWINQGREPLAGPDSTIFYWDNGLLELPVTQVMVSGQWKTLAMPMNLPGDPLYRATLQELAKDITGPPVVFLLHSWSLLSYSGDGKKFGAGAPGKIRKLSRMLSQIQELFDPVSTKGFYEEMAAAESISIEKKVYSSVSRELGGGLQY